jgi:hypothetical protein
MAAFALFAYASSSALGSGQCEAVEFEEAGSHPKTIYVYATTPTSGATILATMGNGFIPANPTHGANCSPTGTTFICGGTFAVFYNEYKRFKAVACMAGKADSAMTFYEVDNR